MIIPCPACNTRYKLPDIALGGKPRKVHCAKCGHMWKQQPGEGLPDPPPRARPGVKPPEQKPLKKKKKKVAPIWGLYRSDISTIFASAPTIIPDILCSSRRDTTR